MERRRASINETKADGSSGQVGYPVCRVNGPLSGCTSCQMASCQETRYPPGFNPEGILFKILAAETEVKVCTCDLRQLGSLWFIVHRIIIIKSSNPINAPKSAANASFFFPQSHRASVHPGTMNVSKLLVMILNDDSSVQTHSRS